MGKLRGSVSRIDSISYVNDGGQDFSHGGDFTMMGGAYSAAAYGDSAMMGNYSGYEGFVPIAGFHNSSGANPGVRPARPVTVKIVCDDSVQQQIVSKLVNLHAYRIVAT